MPWQWWVPLGVVLGLAIGLFAYRRMRVFGHHIHIERAQELFALQRERLEAGFVKQAASNPVAAERASIDFLSNNPVIFARERKSGRLIALVAASAWGVIAKPPPRRIITASVIFYFERGHWQTGPLVPGPPELLLERCSDQYQPITS